MPLIHDLVYQTSTTTGTGNMTVSAITGFETFSDAFNTGSGNTFYYTIRHTNADEWEVGIGYMSNSTVLVRNTLIDSSTGSSINFTSGEKLIACDIPASKQVDKADLIGTIIIWPLNTVKDFTLSCDGSAYSRTTYADLYNAIGTAYGNTTASDFKVPDYRGYFMRGWNDSSSVDPDAASRTDRGDTTTGDNVGTIQSSCVEHHYHRSQRRLVQRATGGSGTSTVNSNNGSASAILTINDDPVYDGFTETRPINKYVHYLIIYQ